MRKIMMLAIAVMTMVPFSNVCAQENVTVQNAVPAQEVVTSSLGQDKNLWNNKKNQIHVSYGFASLTTIAHAVGTIFIAAIDKDWDLETSGSINFGYTYNVNQRLGLGVDATYEHLKASSTLKYDVWSWLARARWYYMQKEKIAMYGKLGAGVIVAFFDDDKKSSSSSSSDKKNEDEDISTRFALQVSPFGIEVGGQTLRGFAEAGFGEQGVIQLGVRCSF